MISQSDGIIYTVYSERIFLYIIHLKEIVLTFYAFQQTCKRNITKCPILSDKKVIVFQYTRTFGWDFSTRGLLGFKILRSRLTLSIYSRIALVVVSQTVMFCSSAITRTLLSSALSRVQDCGCDGCNSLSCFFRPNDSFSVVIYYVKSGDWTQIDQSTVIWYYIRRVHCKTIDAEILRKHRFTNEDKL